MSTACVGIVLNIMAMFLLARQRVQVRVIKYMATHMYLRVQVYAYEGDLIS